MRLRWRIDDDGAYVGFLKEAENEFDARVLRGCTHWGAGFLVQQPYTTHAAREMWKKVKYSGTDSRPALDVYERLKIN
jgi:hypothetical protein